jgi:hydrogenase nickel incorporation protein HypA/HybF
MHEVSVANSIIDIIQSAIPKESNGYVCSVLIKVGALSSIEVDALQFAFDIVKARTLLAKAVLKMEIVEGKGQCTQCGCEFSMNSYAIPCPDCDSYLIKIIQGKEMKVISFELED